MLLQRVLTKEEDQEQLYYRKQGDVHAERGQVCFGKNGSFSTDTYFNSLSVGKWVHYCDLKSIELRLLIEGSVSLTIWHGQTAGEKVRRRVVWAGELTAPERKEYCCRIPKYQDGSIYFTIKARQESRLYSARYEAVPVYGREVRIALNICTYRREQYLLRNLEHLKKEILDNKDSPLYDRLQVFIVDNGQTLVPEGIERKAVYLFPNPNVGGAGGFARGLMEILVRKEKDRITNVIFMDDDIRLEPETIERTYALLRLLKRKYEDAFIGGAMLRLDEKNIQYENGALWNGGKCCFINRGLDLSDFGNVLFNELPRTRDYAAWWFCCIPAGVVREDNLPLPVFIHMDDVEYSLRNAKGIITMNGIAVWHQVLEKKAGGVYGYYDLRNTLIVNARYGRPFPVLWVKAWLFKKMLYNLLICRYREFGLYYQAAADFCRGAGWLLGINPSESHRRLMEKTEHFEPMGDPGGDDEICLLEFKDILKGSLPWRDRLEILKRIVTLNGWLLPPRRKRKIFRHMNVHPMEMYRVGEAVLYDEKEKRGIIVKRQPGQVIAMLRLYWKACRLLDRKYRQSRDSYRRAYKRLCSIGYWEQCLSRENRALRAGEKNNVQK